MGAILYGAVPSDVLRQLVGQKASQDVVGESVGVEVGEKGSQVRNGSARRFRCKDLIEQPGSRFWHGEGSSQGLAKFDHLDTVAAHDVNELRVVTPCLLHVHDLVEQEVPTIRRSQPFLGKARSADEYLS